MGQMVAHLLYVYRKEPWAVTRGCDIGGAKTAEWTLWMALRENGLLSHDGYLFSDFTRFD
jgi:hypothetical protein